MAKKYKCPYCEKRDERAKLVSHIEKYHEDLMPEGYSGTRVVFELINHKTHGTCRVCGKQTGWNEKSGRFDVLCDNPKCKEKMREEYKKNMLRVRGTYNILNDPEQQQKMLANRSISGKYKYSDGAIFTYTGSYEKNCIEFMDQVLNIPSKDIMMPGPTLEYIYNGEKHLYITDMLYIPYNLIIEIKDGGDNLNTKVSPGMISSRERTLAKEKLITDKGEYNYLRLTNNNFAQLIEIFMSLKQRSLEDDDRKIVRVNEFNNLSDTVEYVQEHIVFDEKYIKQKNVKINDDLYILGEAKIYFKNDFDNLKTSFIKCKEYFNFGEYGLAIIPKTSPHEAVICVTNIKALQEALNKTCPKCGGKVGVYIEGEPIYKCMSCGEYLGTVSCSKK